MSDNATPSEAAIRAAKRIADRAGFAFKEHVIREMQQPNWATDEMSDRRMLSDAWHDTPAFIMWSMLVDAGDPTADAHIDEFIALESYCVDEDLDGVLSGWSFGEGPTGRISITPEFATPNLSAPRRELGSES